MILADVERELHAQLVRRRSATGSPALCLTCCVVLAIIGWIIDGKSQETSVAAGAN